MLDFLKKENISEITINYLEENSSSNDIMALRDNNYECLKIISYFKEIGITNIDELLMYETYIFLKLSARVVDKLSECDIDIFVNEVNEDYTNIEKYIS